MSYENLKKFLSLPKAQAGMTVGQNPYNSYSQLNDYLNNMGSTQQGIYRPVNLQQSPNNGYEALNERLNNMPSSQIGVYQPVNLAPTVYNSQTGQYENSTSSNMNSAGNTPIQSTQQTGIPQNNTIPSYSYSQAEDPIYQNMTRNWGNKNQPVANVPTAQQAGYTEQNQVEDNRFSLFNPFSGIDSGTALQYGLYNFGQGNTTQGLLGLSRGLLGTARQGFSAYAAGRNQRDLLNRQNNEPIISSTPLQNGGTINYLENGGSVSVGKFLSGKYITDSSNSNVEIESGEHVLNSETGVVAEAIGETHEKGGIKTNLPNGSQVLSDHTKIGAQNAKELSKELDIKVKAKNTFADVLDKYSKKIGVEKNIEEGEKLVNQTEETLRLEETDSKQINLDFIQAETARVEAEKEALNTQQQEAFKTIFDKQEAQKGNNFMQAGGEVAPNTEEQQVNPDDIILQVQQAIAQGAPIEEILNNLLSMGYTEDLASQIIQASQAQQQPQMQAGGQTGQGAQRIGDFLLSVEAIAQNKGVAPPDIDLTKGSTNENWAKLQNWMVKNAPEEVVSYFDEQPITNKGMEILLKDRKADLKKLGIDTNRKPNSFTLEEKKAIQEAIPLDNKFILDQFADGLADWRFPIGNITGSTQNPQTYQQPTGSLPRQSYQAPIEEEIVTEDLVTAQNQQQRGRNAFPMLASVEGMPPTSALIPRSDEVRFNRIDPVLRTPETSIATINNQANFLNEQSFLSNPNLAPFLTATNLGTTQQSANRAIAETDTYNAEAINRANQYNANIGDKEQLMNINLAQNYEQRLFKTIGNQEEDWRRYLLNKQLQNKQNWMDVNNLNLTNSMTPNYQSDGSNVYFSNPRDYSTRSEADIQFDNWYRNATPQEQIAYRDSVINKKQDGGYIYEFDKGAVPMTDEQAREVAQQTGFTEEFAREYFRQQGNDPLGISTSQTPTRRTANLEVDRIADITAGTNRYTPDGGVIVGDYRKVWLNNKPEYFAGRAQPQEGTDFTYLSPQAFSNFQKTQNYKNYKSGYQNPQVALK